MAKTNTDLYKSTPSLIIIYCNKEQLCWATSSLNISYAPPLTKLQLIYITHVKMVDKYIMKSQIENMYTNIYTHIKHKVIRF